MPNLGLSNDEFEPDGLDPKDLKAGLGRLNEPRELLPIEAEFLELYIIIYSPLHSILNKRTNIKNICALYVFLKK